MCSSQGSKTTHPLQEGTQQFLHRRSQLPELLQPLLGPCVPEVMVSLLSKVLPQTPFDGDAEHCIHVLQDGCNDRVYLQELALQRALISLRVSRRIRVHLQMLRVLHVVRIVHHSPIHSQRGRLAFPFHLHLLLLSTGEDTPSLQRHFEWLALQVLHLLLRFQRRG